MKILTVTPYLGSSYGGVSKMVTEIVQSLGQINISIDLVTTNANSLETLDINLEKWISYKGYRVKYFPCWHRNDLILSQPLIAWLNQHITDYNLVHIHTVFSPMMSLVSWICRINKIPYIITPHGMLEPWALSYKAWKKGLYYTLIDEPSLHKASAIQGISRSETSNLKSLRLKSPIILIPNGIHEQDFKSLPQPEIFYQSFPHTRNKTLILFLGRIDPKKGLDLLAPAFAKVHAQFPETHLIVAGPDNINFLPTAKSYFSEAACSHAVTFTGMLTGATKYAALAAANIYVAPSYSEGFSMSVLEGMAAALPCVITTGCNFPEAAVAEVASVVDINTEQIANALINLLQNPLKAKEMGDRARQFILDNYTWDRIALKMISVYEDLIFRSPTSC